MDVSPPREEDPDVQAREQAAEALVGTVVGTVVAAGVLAASAADEHPDPLHAGLYMAATVFVLWLAHGWARGLGLRMVGATKTGLLAGLRYELPVLQAIIAPGAALGVAAALGDGAEGSIMVAAWVCAIELGLLGAGIALAERRALLRVLGTGLACAALGVAMIALKALVH
jgi:hypothetical protein